MISKVRLKLLDDRNLPFRFRPGSDGAEVALGPSSAALRLKPSRRTWHGQARCDGAGERPKVHDAFLTFQNKGGPSSTPLTLFWNTVEKKYCPRGT